MTFTGPFTLDTGRVALVLDAMRRFHESDNGDEVILAELEALGYDEGDAGPYDGDGDRVATLFALVEDVLRPYDPARSLLTASPGYSLVVEAVCDHEGDVDAWRLIVCLPGGFPGCVQLTDNANDRFPDLDRDDPVEWLVELVEHANRLVLRAVDYFTASTLQPSAGTVECQA